MLSHMSPAIYDTRRLNLRLLTREHGSTTALHNKLGYEGAPTFISQLRSLKPAGRRIYRINESIARDIESVLSLPTGWMDVQHDPMRTVEKVPSPPRPARAPVKDMPAQTTADVITQVRTLVADEKVELSMEKFANLLTLAANDAAAHGGRLREQHVKDLLALMR